MQFTVFYSWLSSLPICFLSSLSSLIHPVRVSSQLTIRTYSNTWLRMELSVICPLQCSESKWDFSPQFYFSLHNWLVEIPFVHVDLQSLSYVWTGRLHCLFIFCSASITGPANVKYISFDWCIFLELVSCQQILVLTKANVICVCLLFRGLMPWVW